MSSRGGGDLPCSLESTPLGHQAMKCLWLGKYEHNWANLLSRLDLGGQGKNDWMGQLEEQIADLPPTFDIELVSTLMSSCM